MRWGHAHLDRRPALTAGKVNAKKMELPWERKKRVIALSVFLL